MNYITKLHDWSIIRCHGIRCEILALRFNAECLNVLTLQIWALLPFNPKRAGGAESAPLDIFLLYLSRLVIYFALKLHDFFPSSLALDLRPFNKKIGPSVMTRRCVIERWVQRKTDQKLIFNGNYTKIVVFFFVFRIHFHYVLSYFFFFFLVYLE